MLKNCIVDLFAEFSDYKEKTKKIANLMENSELLQPRSIKLIGCGTTIGLAERPEGEGYSVAAANFCRQRLCPACQRRRSLRVYAAMSRVYELATDRGYRFLHVVLTVPNCSGADLSRTIDFLYKQSSLLFRRSDDVHTRAACNSIPGAREIRTRIASAFCGVFRALEVTRKEGVPVDNPNAFHPHLHCLVAVRKSYFTSRSYVKYADLRTVWGALTGIENPQIFMGKVTDACAAIAEVAKYAVKPFSGEPDIETLEALQVALFNRRLLQNYGVFREWFHEIGVDDLDEVLDDAEPVPIDVWLTYDGGTYIIDEV